MHLYMTTKSSQDKMLDLIFRKLLIIMVFRHEMIESVSRVTFAYFVPING